MNEHTLSSSVYNTLIISSEIAVVLAVVLLVVLFLNIRLRKKKKMLTSDFLEDVKGNETQREVAIKSKLDNIENLDDAEKQKLIESLLNSEKKLYLHVAQLYMGYKDESLKELQGEIQNISEYYSGIIDKVSKGGEDAGSEGGESSSAMLALKKQVTALREEKKTLKVKNAQLQVDFDAAIDSIDAMTTEFSNMYDGGSKEGEKKLQNEMKQLRQTLADRKEIPDPVEDDETEDVVVSDDEVPDMSLNAAEETDADKTSPDDEAAAT